jgi:aryl-alcohol dehydrogenase-like predicted oxidoreductase
MTANGAEMELPRLGLGTAEFGLDYGYGGRQRPSPPEVRAILAEARRCGAAMLDTAPSYGESEAIIGDCADEIAGMKIATKTRHVGIDRLREGGIDHIEAELLASLERLRRPKVDYLMVHGGQYLSCDDAGFLMERLVRLRERDLTGIIGASFYDPEEALNSIEKFPLGAVQIPLNALDQRFVDAGVIAECIRRDIEVHTRSAFLQGLLLSPLEGLPTHLEPLRDRLTAFHESADGDDGGLLRLALSCVKAVPGVSVVLAGVNSLQEIQEIAAAFAAPADLKCDVETFACNTEPMVNPHNWHQKRT